MSVAAGVVVHLNRQWKIVARVMPLYGSGGVTNHGMNRNEERFFGSGKVFKFGPL